MTARASWAARFLAPFKEPKMHNDDELQSGAGGGEELHPDQDNAPELHSAPGAPAELFTVDRLREVGRQIYGTNPHGLAALDRLAGRFDMGEAFTRDDLSPLEQQVLDNVGLHLSRS